MNPIRNNVCSICEKHKTIRDFVILEDENLLLSHWPSYSEDELVYKGYCFIEPKEHITHLWEMSDRQSEKVGLWAKKLDLAFSEILNSEKTYLFKFADITPHVHFHIYPRHPVTPLDVIGEAVRHWMDVPKISKSEVLNLCKRLRENLRGDE